MKDSGPLWEKLLKFRARSLMRMTITPPCVLQCHLAEESLGWIVLKDRLILNRTSFLMGGGVILLGSVTSATEPCCDLFFYLSFIFMIPHIVHFCIRKITFICCVFNVNLYTLNSHLYLQLLVWITDIKRRIVLTLGLHTDLLFFNTKCVLGCLHLMAYLLSNYVAKTKSMSYRHILLFNYFLLNTFKKKGDVLVLFDLCLIIFNK